MQALLLLAGSLLVIVASDLPQTSTYLEATIPWLGISVWGNKATWAWIYENKMFLSWIFNKKKPTQHVGSLTKVEENGHKALIYRVGCNINRVLSWFAVQHFEFAGQWQLSKVVRSEQAFHCVFPFPFISQHPEMCWRGKVFANQCIGPHVTEYFWPVGLGCTLIKGENSVWTSHLA